MRNIKKYFKNYVRKVRIITLLFIIFFGSSIFFSTVNAFDAPRIYVKEINLSKISFKGGDGIKGDLLMWNSTKEIAADLDYKISLIKDHQVFGEKIFPVSQQISPDGEYRQNFSYTIPVNIVSGKYVMMVRIYTRTGMPLNWNQKDITISGNGNLLIISESKLMQGDKEFAVGIGVNFDPGENPPVAAFSASNLSSKNIEFDLRATVYAVQSNMKELESFSAEKGIFDKGKSKDFSITLPKYIAGTYLAKIAFYEKNVLVSNEESFRWVIKGPSARVIKVVSNEDFFQKGKNASIKVDVAGPADGSGVGSASLAVSIVAKDGTVLAFSRREIKLGGSVASEVFDLAPSADALSPRINVKISKNGKELDNYTTQIKSPNDTNSSIAPIQPSPRYSISDKIFAGLGLSLIVLLVLIAIIKFKKSKKLLIFILLVIPLVGSIVYFGAKIRAPFTDAAEGDFVDLTVVMNKPVLNQEYSFGGIIRFLGDINVSNCINWVSQLSVESFICDKDGAYCFKTVPGYSTTTIPRGMVYINEGGINYYYVLDAGGRVVKYNADKAYVTEFGVYGIGGIGKFNDPNSILYIAPYIYVADGRNSRIVRFNPNAADWLSTWEEYGILGTGQGKFIYPESMTYDPVNNYLYVSDANSASDLLVRFKINPNSAPMYVSDWNKIVIGAGTEVGKLSSRPTGIFYDSLSGYLYVSDSGNARIVRFKPNDVVASNDWSSWQKIGADRVMSVTIDAGGGGSGYTAAPNVTILGGGAPAATGATAVVSSIAGGVIKTIAVTNGGSGYSYANVAISGDGTGARAEAVLSGNSVASINITDGGAGYTAASTSVVITGDGINATANISSIVNGVIKAITVTSEGGGYTSQPTVTIDPPIGPGTTALAQASFQRYNLDVSDSIGVFNRSLSLFYDPDPLSDYVYATDSFFRIVRFKSSDMVSGSRASPPATWKAIGGLAAGGDDGYFWHPNGLVYDSGTGYLHVADQGNYRIAKFNLDQAFADGNWGWDALYLDSVAAGDFSIFDIATTIPASTDSSFDFFNWGSGDDATAKIIGHGRNIFGVEYTVESSVRIKILHPVATYSISGNVFVDDNKDKLKNGSENNYTGAVPAITIDYAGATINALANGTYSISDIPKGTYTVSYTSPPAGYSMSWPSPANLVVTVGPPLCNVVDSTTGGKCAGNNVDVMDLNFAITNSTPWIQTYGFDLRVDDGFGNSIPSTASNLCGGGAYASGAITGSFDSPGIVFSGDGSADFGQGFASDPDPAKKWNWVVGGGTYPEVFGSTKPLKTYTQSLLAAAAKAGIIVTEFETLGPWCNNPSTGCNLNPLQKGFYHTNGDIKIDQNTNFNNGNYVIVSDGTITITNGRKINVIPPATVIFSAKNIIFDSTIGTAAACPVPAGQLQGIFSADRNITVEGNNDCVVGADKMLNIEGSLIVNAARGGGVFENHRDLCGDNSTLPSITIKARPDFILHIPGILTEQNTISQEEAP